MNLEPIGSESDHRDLLVSAEVAGTSAFLLTRTGSHMLGYLKTLNISKKKNKNVNISKKKKP
jgi:Mn-containing catalase